MLKAQKGRAYSRAYACAREKFSEHLKLLEHYCSPVQLKTKWRFLSDYSLYVRSFLTRARCTRHALQKHYTNRQIFLKI